MTTSDAALDAEGASAAAASFVLGVVEAPRVDDDDLALARPVGQRRAERRA